MENQAEQLFLSSNTKEYLKESAKWSKLLAIMGFVGISIVAIGAIFMVLIFPTSELVQGAPYSGSIIAIFYFIFVAIYFYPIYTLYKYAVNTKNAIDNNDFNTVEVAFKYLKAHHKFLGIMMLVVLSLYAVIFLLAIIGGGIAAAAM